MRLLKIGTLNTPKNRWEDALEVFTDIDVFCYKSESEINNHHIHYFKYDNSRILNKILFRCADYCNHRKYLDGLCIFFILLLRVVNYRLLKKVRSYNYDYVHSSYNDFDESAFLTLLLNPKIFTRAQKETRLNYSFFEKNAFEKASQIVLNDSLNLNLFEKKYGAEIFKDKEILYGLDEDVRAKYLTNIIQYDNKFSEKDGKVHAVILAGRALSNPNDKRSGGRLYYVSMIKDLLKAGLVVHLHTGNIVPYEGNNPYEQLERENKDFHIEEKLDFANDTLNAYKCLSRYDIGVCHAHLPNCEVTEFDKVNIPHRYYEYHLAHVVPFDLRGGNLLLEKKADESHAVIYNSYSEITLDSLKSISWDIQSFSDYIKTLYS